MIDFNQNIEKFDFNVTHFEHTAPDNDQPYAVFYFSSSTT